MAKLPTASDAPSSDAAAPALVVENLFVVTKTIVGYAKEDEPEVSVVGVFTCEQTATRVARLTHSQCFPIQLDKISAGVLQSAKAIGVELPAPTDKASRVVRPR